MSGHDEDERPIDRSLIDAACPVLESSETDKARVRRAVMAAVAGGAALAGTASAHAAAATGGAAAPAAVGGASTTAVTGAAVGGAWKIAIGVALLATVAGAVSMAGTSAPSAVPIASTSSASPERVAPSAPSVRAPVPAEPSVAAAVVPEPAAPEPEPSPAITPPPHERTTIAAATTPEDDVRDEARLIALANAAIDRHDGAAALAILADYAHRHPDGQLREERFAARIFALCETGDETRARAEARSFLNVFPASAHLERIRTSCAGTP